MPIRHRQRIPPTDNWQQLELRFATPGQRSYEVIRPVVLFGEPVPERATATQTHARTIYRTVARFEAAGLCGLEPPPRLPRHQRVPEEVQQAIVDLRREYPPLHLREIATICWARFGQRLSHHTVRRILAESPPPPRTSRRFPPYHAIPDPFARRRAVLQLHVEGWHKASIAAYLEVSRPTVDDILKRWVTEDLAGLHDKSRRPHRLRTKQTLAAIHTVERLQQNPALGEFRVYVALKQLGIELSPRTCGRILALNRTLYGLPKPAKTPHDPKPMPFAAQYRHHVWSTDVRYLDHHLGDFKVYAITILDNYSRAVLASEVTRRQDLGAFLRVLRQALERWGVPTMLVTDSGKVFLAKGAQRVYGGLGIQKAEIDRRQPWQNYIETTFNIQRRMADWDFGRVQSWEELVAVHDQWVSDYNTQEHWAHRRREDERRSPATVLDWVRGRSVSAEELATAFTPAETARRVDRGGYVRFRRWRLYAERGLARQRAAVWLTGEQLLVSYSDEPLAQYVVTYALDGRHFAAVREEQLFNTAFQSSQPPLWEPREGEWLRVLQLPASRPRRPHRSPAGEQLLLFAAAE
jgi:putative transposase